jgi:chemotaxis protein histidine kinase CheA
MTPSLRKYVKKTVDDVTTKLKQLTGLIDDIRSVQLRQVEHHKEKFTSEIRVLSENIHSIVNFVTDLHITRANDFLVLQQQNLKHDLAKAETLYKEYSSVATQFERSLHETHDIMFLVQHKPLKKDYDDLDVIPKPEVPQRLEEFKQEEFTTLVIDKMKEKYDLSLIR